MVSHQDKGLHIMLKPGVYF